jgi:hypothetical protein
MSMTWYCDECGRVFDASEIAWSVVRFPAFARQVQADEDADIPRRCASCSRAVANAEADFSGYPLAYPTMEVTV